MLLYHGTSDMITVPKKVKSVKFECCSVGFLLLELDTATSSKHMDLKGEDQLTYRPLIYPSVKEALASGSNTSRVHVAAVNH